MESIKKADSYAIKKYNEIINEIKEYPTTEYNFIMETFMQTFITEFILNVVMANNFNANDKEKMMEIIVTIQDTCLNAMHRGIEAAKNFQEARNRAHREYS